MVMFSCFFNFIYVAFKSNVIKINLTFMYSITLYKHVCVDVMYEMYEIFYIIIYLIYNKWFKPQHYSQCNSHLVL